MLTDGVRDKVTHKVDFPGPMRLMLAQGRGDKAAVRATLKETKAAANNVDTSTMQLHLIVHSEQKNHDHFPPFQVFMHFMWDEVTWH